MRQLSITADDLVSALLRLSEKEPVCLLDSCRVGHLNSHLLIAGIEPVATYEITNDDPLETLRLLDETLSGDLAAIFTISYEFGQKLLGLKGRKNKFATSLEPDLFVALFDTLIVHDYNSGETNLVGNHEKFDSIREMLTQKRAHYTSPHEVREPINAESALTSCGLLHVTSNFTKKEYLAAIETIKERIRDGDTYQTNLTQQLTVTLPDSHSPAFVFKRLRRDHPAPFAAFIKRSNSVVVSASPERFFRVVNSPREHTGGLGSDKPVRSPHVSKGYRHIISTSPIKGTRRRGINEKDDHHLRNDLLNSIKDRAENTMIVDLLRNDLGRVCEFGSVRVEKLCDLEEHPTLFHLVSTISGELRDRVRFSDILSAVFPCGSITGAPKISTMMIIDELETEYRGLSMGAIGYYVPSSTSQVPSRPFSWDMGHGTLDSLGLGTLDLSVAIRTMVISDNVAGFNVGGGITIDSDPEMEYDETLLKAKALLNALGYTGTI
ncbi:MAG: anthranilate synthase component I family protein [Pyrinomonadaceae bacterium]